MAGNQKEARAGKSQEAMMLKAAMKIVAVSQGKDLPPERNEEVLEMLKEMSQGQRAKRTLKVVRDQSGKIAGAEVGGE